MMNQANLEQIIGSFEKAVHLNPNSAADRVMLGQTLIEHGHVDRAIFSLERALSLDPQQDLAKSLLQQAQTMIGKRNTELQRNKRFGNYTLKTCLGIGWEGAVYLALDPQGDKYVLKIFHPHIRDEINGSGPLQRFREPVRRCLPDLVRLSDLLKEQGSHDTLYSYELVRENSIVAGLKYRHETLLRISKRYISYPHVADCIAGAFFRTNAYLNRNLRLSLADASLTQWMITGSGSVRFIDYGYDIIPVDDFRCKEDHWQVVALVILLYQMFNPKKRRLFHYTNFEIVFHPSNGILGAVKRHPWLKNVFEAMESKNYSLFLDPEFNSNIAKGLPKRIRITDLSKILALDVFSKTKNKLVHRSELKNVEGDTSR